MIETADTILHKPTGEKWYVAYCRGGYVCCCGWPESLAPVADCELLEKGTEEDREKLLVQMAAGGGSEYDSRKSYARNVFHEREVALRSRDGAGI